MNKNKLMGKLVTEGKNVDWLARQIGISTSAMYQKINGNTNTTIDDAKIIKNSLKLNDQETTDIFFS